LSEEAKSPLEYYKHVSLFWTDLLHLMSGKPIALSSVGPMRNYANDLKKVDSKVPSIPQDVENIEAYKRVWIDIFENDFTGLFDSEKFGQNYGKMVSAELELAKHWENILNVILQSMKLPTKKEINEVYKEMHDLRRRVSKLEKKEETKNAE